MGKRQVSACLFFYEPALRQAQELAQVAEYVEASGVSLNNRILINDF